VPAYSIAEVTVIDPAELQKYSDLAAPAIEAQGGKFLFAGVPDAAEGEWPEGRVIAVFEFPTIEHLRAWYASAEYAQAREVGKLAFERNLLFVDSPAW
jgi:uncharacterized protein (DUF1330 family)